MRLIARRIALYVVTGTPACVDAADSPADRR
jgi:hypothetical protein